LVVDPMSSSLNPTFVPPGSRVKLRSTEVLTAEVNLWVVNHNSQATSDGPHEHTYSFVAERDVEFTCQKTHVKWRGEGTIQAESDAGNIVPSEIPVWRRLCSGTFTITFEVQDLKTLVDSFYPPGTGDSGQEDGTSQEEETEALTPEEERQLSQNGIISGEGTASVTGTEEYTQIDSQNRPELWVHCTKHWQATVPLVVAGGKKGNRLTLGFSSESDWAGALGTVSQSCTGPGAEFFGSGVSKIPPRFRMDIPSLEVTAEDGATGQSVEESFDLGIKSRALSSIRIKALPPEEGGSPTDRGATGQNSSEFPGPLLPDY
jgi:hypothetical protein